MVTTEGLPTKGLATEGAATEGQDGRTARKDRNRELVLDAALELFAEGHLMPAATQVADRSGVSLRSVFRYYDDTEALLRAAIARHMERVAPLFDVPDLGVGPFEERLDRFIEARLKLYEAVAPTARAASVRAGTNKLIAAQFELAREHGRELLEQMFEPELSAMPTGVAAAALNAADTLMQFEGMEHLFGVLGLTRAEAFAAINFALAALFSPR